MSSMVGRIQTQTDRLLTPRCVRCGDDSRQLADPEIIDCPSCGCDLIERPARSYAEMEGLIGHPMPLDMPGHARARRDDRLVRHWIAFAFLVFIFMIVFVSLAAAALP